MRRQMLSLFLTVIILISVGGVVSIVGATSHVNPAQASKPTVKTDTCNFIGDARTHVYHYPWCWDAKHIKPENIVCFNSACDAVAAGYRPSKNCNTPGC